MLFRCNWLFIGCLSGAKQQRSSGVEPDSPVVIKVGLDPWERDSDRCIGVGKPPN